MLLLWREAWGVDDILARMLQAVPRETQRLIVTADAAGSSGAVERHAWRAPVVDLLGAPPAEPAPQVRSAPVAWRRRIEALADLAEQLDPESLALCAPHLRPRHAPPHP